MKIKLLFIVALLSFVQGFAQNDGVIKGLIYDKSLNQPLPYVTISINEGGKFVNGTITDENGDFLVKNLEAKKYNLEIQFIGYKSILLEADLTLNKALDFGKLLMEDDTVILDGVEIVSERSTIEQKIDRKVINVGRDLTTAGATASEIMNNVPSVNVDQDGNISLRGNQNVRVLIDGRPTNIDPAQLLKQIPSSSIKQIELITNPSAKYNPEGMSGIINIILHKNTMDGFNGNVNAGVTFGKTPKGNASVNLNYRVGKVNFFGTFGGNVGKYHNEGIIKRLDQDMDQILSIVNDNDSYLYKIGLDYFINDKNTISVFTNRNKLDGFGGVMSNNIYTTNYLPNIVQYSKFISGNITDTYNFAYRRLMKKDGETLDVELNYNVYNQDQDATFDTRVESQEASVYKDFIEDSRKLSTLNIDYVNPLTDNSRLELGAEARLTRTDNVYNTSNPLSSFTESNYDYDVDIYSLYATYGQNFSKFSYKLGARFESYNVKAAWNNETLYKDDYITLYPSVFLGYNIDEKNMLQLSYSRRVDRPNLQQTKPIREFATPTVTSIGNPELDPQFTNSLEVNYTKVINKGSITAGVFFRKINDEINRIIYDDVTTENPNDMIMSYDNFEGNTAFGYEMSMNYKMTPWWDFQPAVDYSSINQKGLVAELTGVNQQEFIKKEVNVSAFNARLNNNFKVNKNLSLTLFGFYRGQVDGIQNNSKEMYKIDAGARYAMLNNRLSISLRVNDIFDTMKYAFDMQNPYPSRGQFTWESRTAYLGVNYMFGGGKNRSLQRKYREDNTKQNSGGLF